MDIQQRLTYLTREEIKDISSSNLRGVAALWEGNMVKLSFYFDGEITASDREAASDACTYIIAHFSDALMEENYIRLDCPTPLPTEFLVYVRDEKK